MKNKLIISIAFFLTLSLVKCSTDEKENNSNVLNSIQKDIAGQKAYPNVKNRYDYSSKNYFDYIKSNSSIYSKTDLNTFKSQSISLDSIKQSVKDFYYDKGYSENQIDAFFDENLQNLKQYQSYQELLSAKVKDGIIPKEEKEIIESFLDYYFETDTYEDFSKITDIFIYNVNSSNFNEFEKRGMLTIFDTFRANFNKNYDTIEDFSFTNKTNTLTAKVSKDTECGGRMLIGMIGGALTGNGIGFVVGTAAAFFENWVAGCFD